MDYPAMSESPHPASHPIEQGNPSPSTAPLMRKYEWDQHTDMAHITEGYIVQGTLPGSRHPFPHDPVDPTNG